MKTDAPDRNLDAGDPDALFAAGNTNELLDIDFGHRRRWPALIAGAVLGVAGTLIAAGLIDNNGDEASTETAVDLDLATAPVERRDLVEAVEWTADLGYGSPTDVAAATNVTVTAGVDAGMVLTRGDVVYEADDNPVVVFYGQLPFWRSLSEGDDGPDVEQMETNLVALGYDPDTTVTIDDTFTANTALMIERWQENIGAEITGELELGAAVVVPGPVSVTTAPVVGQRARAGDLVTSLTTRAQTTTVVGALTGEVSHIAEVGTAIEHGSVLYTADGVDVLALTTLDSIAQLLVDLDADPLALEGALAFSGYDPQAEMAVDGAYDEATEAAVARWQLDTGLPATGQTSAGAYVVVTPGLQVSAALVGMGQTLTAPHPVLELAEATLSVVIPVGLADQDEFFVGQELQVELPDGSVVDGVVIEVGTVAQTDAAGADPTIDVTVEITDAVDEDLPASQVTVVVAGEIVSQALVVPTRALITLTEGGFAVEKMLIDGTSILVAVETGTFDDGVVEVVTSQLEPGDMLVVPQ